MSSSNLLIQRAAKLVNEIYPDKDCTKPEPERVIFLHYIISVSRRLGYKNDAILKADPIAIKPGLNPTSCDISMLDDYYVREFNDRWTCLLCKHIPVDPLSCKKCKNLYCKRCILYLVRLQSASMNRDLETSIDEYCIFICINCDNGTCFVQGVDLDGDPIYDYALFNCNRINCAFKASGKTISNHLTSCNLTRCDYNLALISSLCSLPQTSIAKLIVEYQNSIKVFRAAIPESADSIAIAERPPSPVPIEKESSQSSSCSNTANSTAVASSSQSSEYSSTANSTAVAGSSQSTFTHFTPVQLTCENISSIPFSDFISGAILPRKLKPNSAISLKPHSSGDMTINSESVSVVKASQIIGDRSHQNRVDDRVWDDRFIKAMKIDDPKKRRNVVNNLRYRTTKKARRNELLSHVRQRKYQAQLQRFTPKLFIRYPFTDAAKLTFKNIEICKNKGLKVIAMDIEGQTLTINNRFYRVPGSIGIVGNGGDIVVHDIIHWPKDLLHQPDKPNYITGLDFKACQHGPTLAYARKKTAQALLDADIIVLHGQAGDLKGLFFNQYDYDLIKDKIRDIGAYYNIRTASIGCMSVQLATYLIFQEMIQGKKLHYAIQDAYFTLMLYYADMEDIEYTYESCKHDIIYEGGFTKVIYPPNAQMASLYLNYADNFDHWPLPIKLKKFGGERKLGIITDDETTIPDLARRAPYNTPLNFFQKFYKR